MSKNIEMNYKIDSGYEVIYPNVQTKSVTDISNYYYDKTQVDDKIQESKDYTDGLSFKKNLIVNNVNFNLNSTNGQQVILANNVNVSQIIGLYILLNLNVTWTTNANPINLVFNERSSYISENYILFDSESYIRESTVFNHPILIFFDSLLNEDGLLNLKLNGAQFEISSNNQVSIILATQDEFRGTGNITIYSLTY